MANGRTEIRRADQKDELVADVLAQLRDGELRPGDRLLSFKDLCGAYNASQHTVRRALAELDARGVILRKPRSGYYVRQHAREAVARDAEPAAPPAREAAPAGHDPAAALYPMSEEVVLTVYVADALPQKLQLWREAFAAFEREHHTRLRVELFCGKDGHLQELIREAELDFVQAPPQVLQSIGPEEFLPVTDLAAYGLETGDLLEPVVRYLATTARPLVGVPFSLTMPYLFVNEELGERLGTNPALPDEPVDLLRQSAAAAARHPEIPCRPFAWSDLGELLLEAGALQPCGDGGVDLCEERAAEAFAALARVRDAAGSLGGGLGAFRRGTLLAWRHHSFTRLSLNEECSCRWRTLPPPLHPRGSLAPILCVLAVRRGTRHLQTCLDLVQFLSLPENQQRFARSGGNLPVRRDAVFAPESLAVQPFGEAAMEAYLRRCDLTWHALRRNLPLASDLRALARGFERGGLSAAQALERLRVIDRRHAADRNAESRP